MVTCIVFAFTVWMALELMIRSEDVSKPVGISVPYCPVLNLLSIMCIQDITLHQVLRHAHPMALYMKNRLMKWIIQLQAKVCSSFIIQVSAL